MHDDDHTEGEQNEPPRHRLDHRHRPCFRCFRGHHLHGDKRLPLPPPEAAGGGEWVAEPNLSPLLADSQRQVEPFAAVHRLLREHQVQIVMAGDTHYFEHYRETYQADGQPRTMYHFVNGGGGAYISIGTALDWPATPAPVRSVRENSG